MNLSWILIAVLTFLVVLVVLSYIVEAVRSAPKRRAVILHRMWIDGTTYRWAEAKPIAAQA